MAVTDRLVSVAPQDPPAVVEEGFALVQSYLSTLQSPKSRSTMVESFRRIAVELGIEDYRTIPWHKLGFNELQLIKQKLAASRNPATANLTLTALRQMMRIGYLTGKVSQEQLLAAQALGSVRGTRLTKGRALTQSEVIALFRASEASSRGPMMRAMLAVMLGAGVRREEVCRLTLENYGGDELVVLGKGNKERRAYLDEPTMRHLDAWIAVRPEAPHRCIFLTKKALAPVPPWAVWYLLKTVGIKAGIRAFGPHDLRRTFASRLLDGGLDLAEVQRLLGHSSISTTAIYDKRTENSLAVRRRGVRVFE